VSTVAQVVPDDVEGQTGPLGAQRVVAHVGGRVVLQLLALAQLVDTRAPHPDDDNNAMMMMMVMMMIIMRMMMMTMMMIMMRMMIKIKRRSSSNSDILLVYGESSGIT
jgi:hypothetical protein